MHIIDYLKSIRQRGAIVFGTLLLLVAAAYYWTKISKTLLFWAAFILTRPLGAVVGDFLDKPISAGGLALSRYSASAVLLVVIIACVLIFEQRPAKSSGHSYAFKPLAEGEPVD